MQMVKNPNEQTKKGSSEHSHMIKNPDEIINIAKAAAIGDIAFEHILGFIKEGMTEKEIAKEIERVLFTLGCEDLAFPTICVSGENSSNPHGEPTDKRIEVGDFLTMDFGGVYNGYCGDMTRTIAIGGATKEMTKIYDIVLESQIAGLEAICDGVKCFDVDKASRDVIAKAGYGKYYIHGTGHGVGEEVHEEPTLNSKSDQILKEDMPVTVEPGIYIPGKFGVRIEDLVIVTKFGIVNLVESPKDLIIL